MPTLSKRLTDTLAKAIACPAAGSVLHWCPATPGFAVRAFSTGAKAWIYERRIDGETVRRTLGRVDGRGAISAQAARALLLTVSGELAQGVDRSEQRRELARENKAERAALSLTFAQALGEYVDKKRRGTDTLALKARTKSTYLGMVEPASIGPTGRQRLAGMLYPVADKSIHAITGEDIRALHAAALKRNNVCALQAMRVLCAVLNWHGVQVSNSPFDKSTPGRERITLQAKPGNPTAIPRALLGAWWNAALNAGRSADKSGGSRMAADCARLMLITGARPGEILQTEFEPGLVAGRVNLEAAEMTLGGETGTKNRRAHVVKLSRQAVQILRPYVADKRANAQVFPVLDLRKTMAAINQAAGVPAEITPHNLRHTFVSIAGARLPEAIVKSIVNHSGGNDVTFNHYFDPDTDELRAAWQLIADYVERLANETRAKTAAPVLELVAA